MIEATELAVDDYSKYLKTDTQSEVKSIEETIENMLMRFEEYKGTLEMISSERSEIESAYKNIMKLKSDVSELAYRVDGMEMFISRVHRDMNSLETQLLEAEQDYPDRSEMTLKSLFKPIISKISPELAQEASASGMSSATVSSYEKVEIINTDELFKPSED
ncbi:uncharacterized protein LOC135832039 [Planococcus citri]|uniref:uncharacterized protein LOC135832039 n=1 Tax=Planococcus citri TaxID=170843 RepID=UPI0031F8D1DE